MLADELRWPFIEEDVESHPFLPRFYADPRRFALETEICFVLLHYHQHNRAVPQEYALSDFSPVKDLVFARINLTSHDLEIFDGVYRPLIERVSWPSLVVFLDPPLEDLLVRIKNRGRPYEQGIEVTYLRQLREEYEKQMASLGDSVIVLPVDHGESVEDVHLRVRREVDEFINGGAP